MLEAGTRENIQDQDGTCVLSYVRHGAELACAGGLEFHGLVACDTVDECFFGGRTETFRTEPFDEKLCDNWHLYAVERCLRARTRGGRVWVCDVPLIHHSGGNINHSYNEGFRRIAAHYAKLPDGGSGRKVRERIPVSIPAQCAGVRGRTGCTGICFTGKENYCFGCTVYRGRCTVCRSDRWERNHL